MKSSVYTVLEGYGVDGSRTRVQKSIPRPSTIIVHPLGFPLPDSGGQLSGFGSFMIRTQAQSFACAVSYLFDASLPADRYSGLTAAKPQAAASAKLSFAFILFVRFNAISFG